MDDARPEVTDTDLWELHASMSLEELRKLAPVLIAIRRWVDITRNVTSDFATEAFCERFALSLRVFHALNDRSTVLTKKPFEFAFKEAIEADGTHEAELTEDPTFAGCDLVLDRNVRVSLKTEAARDIRRDRVLISKLMESAWTKDCQTRSDFLTTIPRILQHLASYDRIIGLRVFGRLDSDKSIQYDLVEIPVAVLSAAAQLRESDFGNVTRAHGVSAQVSRLGEPLYKLVFDGSDQKITVRDLRIEHCIWHASWTLT